MVIRYEPPQILILCWLLKIANGDLTGKGGERQVALKLNRRL